MQFVRAFSTRENPSSARDLIDRYLTKAGYKQVAGETDLAYQRGSALGSRFSFSPKGSGARLNVQIQPVLDGASEILAVLEVNTTGQFVTGRERQFFEKEMDGLVAAPFGVAHQVPAIYRAAARQESERQFGSSVNWFYAIALLSLINSLVTLWDGSWSFLIGLGATQYIDAVGMALAQEIGGSTARLVMIATACLDLLVAGIFALCGFLARRRSKAAYITGMVLYALDGLILLQAQDIAGLVFHLFALAMLYQGLRMRDALVSGPSSR